MHTSLLKKAMVDAAGVLAYILVLTWIMNHGQQIIGTPQPWIMGTLMLITFVVSACITGGLVLGLPLMMYLDGQRRQAVTLLMYTVASLVGIAVLLGVLLVLWK